MQEYLPLTNFLKHQAHYCADPIALDSINSQIAYLQQLHANRLTEEELQKRAERMRHLKRRWQATFTDNRRTYSAQTTRAISKLCGVAA